MILPERALSTDLIRLHVCTRSSVSLCLFDVDPGLRLVQRSPWKFYISINNKFSPSPALSHMSHQLHTRNFVVDVFNSKTNMHNQSMSTQDATSISCRVHLQTGAKVFSFDGLCVMDHLSTADMSMSITITISANWLSQPRSNSKGDKHDASRDFMVTEQVYGNQNTRHLR